MTREERLEMMQAIFADTEAKLQAIGCDFCMLGIGHADFEAETSVLDMFWGTPPGALPQFIADVQEAIDDELNKYESEANSPSTGAGSDTKSN